MKKYYIFFLMQSLFALLTGNPHNTILNQDEMREDCTYCHKNETTAIKSSVRCLNCHDGVNAINIITKTYLHSTEFSQNMHPIHIQYTENISSLESKYTFIYEWSNASTINDLLNDGKLECISCHNPHDNRFKGYLRHSNKNSGLCKTCHNK